MTEKSKINELIENLRTGAIKPDSKEGQEAIGIIALDNPANINRLHRLSDDMLEKAMRSVGMTNKKISEILGSGGTFNPFAAQSKKNDPFASKNKDDNPDKDNDNPDKDNDDPDEDNPLILQPYNEMMRGPRPR